MPVRLPSSRRRWGCSALAFLIAASLLAAQPRTLEDVVAAAAAYVGQYETELGVLMAEEHYDQKVTSRGRRAVSRRLDSQFLFLRLPGTNEWLGFRDVYAVNGRPVRARDDRLAALLIDPTADVAVRARAIVGESSRFNLGREEHTVNVPPLVLDWITERVRPRLVFAKGGEERIRGIQTWRIRFKEISRPTLVRTPQGEDALSEGSYWIEPETGRILETELISHVDIGSGSRGLEPVARGFKVRSVTSTVRVSYRPDSRLSVLVPVEMREKLDVPPYGGAEGTAKYSNFRRFEATARIK
jgi:hypothetical protein